MSASREGHAAGNHPYAPLLVGAITAGTLTMAFSLMALDIEWFWVLFPVGFGGVLPLSLGALHYRRATQQRDTTAEQAGTSDTENALDELQMQYARGELTDAEFEHRTEQLLETADTVESGDRTR